MLTEREVELFNDSLERAVAHGLLGRFYEIFVSTSAEIAQKFEDTDLHRQQRALKTSLYLMMLAAEGKAEGNIHLERIAKLHGPDGLAIRPALYDVWLECLLSALVETDPYCNDEIVQAWRRMMHDGVEFMKRYSQQRLSLVK